MAERSYSKDLLFVINISLFTIHFFGSLFTIHYKKGLFTNHYTQSTPSEILYREMRLTEPHCITGSETYLTRRVRKKRTG